MLLGPCHRGSVPCGRYPLVRLTGNKKGSRGLMVLRVKLTPIRFPTNSPYTLMDDTPLHSIPSVGRPWNYSIVGYDGSLLKTASNLALTTCTGHVSRLYGRT